MSFTQVYVSGLSKSIHPSDEEIENLFVAAYNLDTDEALLWAGPETTLVKRVQGACRGFAFLTFYSADGAAIVVDRINSGVGSGDGDNNTSGDGSTSSTCTGLPSQLRAEISNPKASKKSKGQKSDINLPDLRLRRMRKAPVRKHPVITNSDGTRTNLGNKTK
jgi:hypothetical protein